MADCAHKFVTSTRELGWHCFECKERLLSLALPISLNLFARAMARATQPLPPTNEE